MRENESSLSDDEWLELFKDDYTRPEVLADIVTAHEVKHQKTVSRGMAAMMGAAALLMFDKVGIQDFELTISLASDPRLTIAANVAFVSGTVSAASRIKAAIIENKAGSAYSDVLLQADFKHNRQIELLESLYKKKTTVDKEIQV